MAVVCRWVFAHQTLGFRLSPAAENTTHGGKVEHTVTVGSPNIAWDNHNAVPTGHHDYIVRVTDQFNLPMANTVLGVETIPGRDGAEPVTGSIVDGTTDDDGQILVTLIGADLDPAIYTTPDLVRVYQEVSNAGVPASCTLEAPTVRPGVNENWNHNLTPGQTGHGAFIVTNAAGDKQYDFQFGDLTTNVPATAEELTLAWDISTTNDDGIAFYSATEYFGARYSQSETVTANYEFGPLASDAAWNLVVP